MKCASVRRYTPAPPGGPTTATFTVAGPITLRGGYAGYGAPDPELRSPAHETILSGDRNGDDQPNFARRADNCRTVLTVAVQDSPSDYPIEGFIIEGGNGGQTSASAPGGAGMLAAGPVFVRDCLFRSNLAGSTTLAPMGGAVLLQTYFGHQTPVRFHRCFFESNRAARGGALAAILTSGFFSQRYPVDCMDCDFVGNESVEFGAAIMSDFDGARRLQNCRFINNIAGTQAGAVHFSQPRDLYIADCVFSGNRAGGSGGALYFRSFDNILAVIERCLFDRIIATEDGGAAVAGFQGPYVFRRCRFVGNQAGRTGGAVALIDGDTRLENCWFSGNAAENGGAIWNLPTVGSLTVQASSIVGNRALQRVGGVSVGGFPSATLSNSLLWGNRDGQGDVELAQLGESSFNLTLRYCNVEGWSARFGGVGNFGADPALRDADGPDDSIGTAVDDYHLLPGSICIDRGDPDYEPPTPLFSADRARDLDLDGELREWQGTIDIGADEVGSTLVGDANCDRRISFDDIAAFVTALVSADAYAAAYPACDFRTTDISGDGAVAFDDIDVFVACLVDGGCH